MIHKTAIIDPKAKLNNNVQIGPYCVIGPNVEIEENCIIQSHVSIVGNTKIGKNNKISHAKYYLEEYDFPVFPDDFAYYLLKDNKTLVMISAVKSLNANFKFDIIEKKLELYPTTGKFDFIISSFAKNCGYFEFKDNYKCSFYKPLISSNLIN